jgi:hypothetical protein
MVSRPLEYNGRLVALQDGVTLQNSVLGAANGYASLSFSVLLRLTRHQAPHFTVIKANGQEAYGSYM